MLTYTPTPSRPHACPPPLWTLFHAGEVVGPLSTNRLVRGVLHGRVPSGAVVRERAWSTYRPLDRIREVAELRREQARHGRVHVPRARFERFAARRAHRDAHLDRLLRRALDPGDLLLLSLGEMMRTTGALVGAVHRYRRTEGGLVTLAASGPGMLGRLGHRLPSEDLVLEAARRGETLCSDSAGSPLARIVSERLGALPACAGVAMVPIVVAGRVYAFAELGRPDHPFRRTDHDASVRVANAAATRIGVVKNPLQRV